MLEFTLCDSSDALILNKGIITVENKEATDVNESNTNKKEKLKDYAIFTGCMSESNNTEVDKKDLDTIMSMCNLIEYRENYSKLSGKPW